VNISSGAVNLSGVGNITGAFVASGGSWIGTGSAGSFALSAWTFTLGSAAVLTTPSATISGGTLVGSGTLSSIPALSSGAINFTNPGKITGNLNTTGGSWNGAGS